MAIAPSQLARIVNAFSPAKSWHAYAGLLIALFLARGLCLLSIVPPLEGWDEYQHVAVMQYVVEHERSPIMHAPDAKVSPELLRRLAELPQPALMLEQTRGSGGAGYADFWNEPRRLPPVDMPDVGLYQAQQGGFYYRIVTPLYRATGGLEELRTSIAALRILNLAFAAISLTIVLVCVGRLIVDRRQAAVAALVITLQPLLLLNSVRVANDSLAILLITLVVAWALQPRLHGSVIWAGLAGLAAGAALHAKAFGMVALPLLPATLLISLGRRQIDRRRAMLAATAALTTAAAVTAPYFAYNIMHFGFPMATTDTLAARAAGLGLADLWRATTSLDWGNSLIYLWLDSSSWVGGWSFLRADRTLHKIGMLLLVCMLIGGLWPRLSRASAPGRVFTTAGTTARLVAIVILTSAALGYHMIQSMAVHGIRMTVPWYAVLAYPWALMLVCGGAARWPIAPLRLGLPGAMALTYASIELTATIGTMIPAYSGGASGALALERLASVQSAALGTTTLLGSAVVASLLAAIAVVATLSAARVEPASRT